MGSWLLAFIFLSIQALKSGQQKNIYIDTILFGRKQLQVQVSPLCAVFLCQTPVLGLGLGADFTFKNNHNENHNSNNNNTHLNFLKGTVVGDQG